MSNQVFSNESDIYEIADSGKFINEDGGSQYVKINGGTIRNDYVLGITSDSNAGTIEDPYEAQWQPNEDIKEIQWGSDLAPINISSTTFVTAKQITFVPEIGENIVFVNFVADQLVADSYSSWQVTLDGPGVAGPKTLDQGSVFSGNPSSGIFLNKNNVTIMAEYTATAQDDVNITLNVKVDTGVGNSIVVRDLTVENKQI